MTNSNTNPDNGWRDNWIVKNWLTAIPLARAVTEKTVPDGLDRFLGDSFMLSGGVVLMSLNIFHMRKNEERFVMDAEMTGTMVLGMGGGMAIYNTLKSGACMFKQKLCAETSETDRERENLIP